jgi:uncharacterized protein (TIGR02996 family)
MIWNPETPEEIRAANLFYDAAYGLNEFTKKVKAGKPVRRTAEHTAFIKGILANRDDDTGYLAYADYLTERGDSQGDFIRACVELSRLPADHPDIERLNQQTNDLMDAHAKEWYAPLGELGLRPEFRGDFTPYAWMSFQRGVIEEVTIDRAGVLPQNAARLFAAAPFLRKLEFEKGHLDPAGLAKVKQLTQIDTLKLSFTELTAKGLRVLLRSKYLTGLKTLDLFGNDFGDAGAAVLAAWPAFAKLESLDVASCSLTATGVEAIVGCPNAANLTRLRIGSNQAGAGGLSIVLDSPHLKKLRELELGGMEFYPVTAGSFDTTSFAKTLEHLDLDSAQFQIGGFEAFALCKLPALRCLKLKSVDLRLPAASQLANAPFTSTLEELYLDNCHLGAASANFFHQGKFPKLTTLDVSRNRIQGYGTEMLAASARHFPALTELRLWDNQITPQAVERLAKSAILANVTNLDLSDNKIGPAGALALAKSKYLKKLTWLTVSEKSIGKKGKQALVDRFGESAILFR